MDSFLTGLGRNQLYGARYLAKMAHKPVQQSGQMAVRAMINLATGNSSSLELDQVP